MITSQIQATLPYNIKIVWQAVTDIKITTGAVI